jgi:Flp pilus assembly pilin Flp
MVRSPTDARDFELVEFALFATKISLVLVFVVVALGDAPTSALAALAGIPVFTGSVAGVSLLRSRSRLADLDDDLRADT